MIIVECIDANNTSVLSVGTEYYAFPVNSNHAYISKFPKEHSHTGCFSLQRFVEIPQAIEQKVLHEYRYEIFALKKHVTVYGFEVNHRLIAIYKDSKLEQFIGCVPKERCTILQQLEPVTSWGAYTVFPSSLRIGDIEDLLVTRIEVPVPREDKQEIHSEQLSLF